MEIKVEINADSAAWFDNEPSDELRFVLRQVQYSVVHDSCGPSGFVKQLKDSNGNVTGKVTVTL